MKKIKYVMAALGVAMVSAICAQNTHVNAAATIQQSKTMTGHFEFSTTQDGYAIIEKYIGTDTYLEIPEQVVAHNGNTFTVVELSDYMLSENNTVEKIYIPKTVVNIVEALRNSSSLKNIIVENHNPYFYSTNGILMRKFSDANVLYTYPQSADASTYIVGNDIDELVRNSFYKTKYLNKVILDTNISFISFDVFNAIQTPVSIVFKHDNMERLYVAKNAFNMLKEGSKVIVKNNKMKEYFEKNINLENIEVLSLENSANSSYRVPSTSLKFNDNTTKKSITLSANETYSLRGQFTQLPENTTDTVTWTSSDPSVATITNGGTKAFTITAGKNAGKCKLTGKDDSGRTLVVDVEVYIPLDKDTFDIYWGADIVTSMPVTVGDQQTIDVDITPLNSSALLNGVQWASSNPNAVKIVRTANKTWCTIEALSTGTSTVTAKVVDNGKTIEKSITVNAVKSISSCKVDPIKDQIFTDKEIKPVIVVKDGTKTLIENVDYTLRYRNNINEGNAKVDIIGKNHYYDAVTVGFMIYKPASTPQAPPTSTPGGNSTPMPNVNTTPAVSLKNQSISARTSYFVAYGSKAFSLNATAKTGLSYSSSNNNIVKVDKYGKVTLVGTGVAAITIKASQSGSYKGASLTVKISVNPKKVSGLKMKTSNTSSITLSWKKDVSVTGYKVYRYDPKTKKYVVIKTITKNSTTSFKDSNRTSGASYQYKVHAYKSVAKANLIGAGSTAVTVYTKPGKAAVSKVAQTKKTITITWRKNTTTTGYQVYRSTSKNGKFTKVGTVTKNSKVNFIDKSVKKGKTYYYKVRTYKSFSVNRKKVTVYGSYSTVKKIKVK